MVRSAGRRAAADAKEGDTPSSSCRRRAAPGYARVPRHRRAVGNLDQENIAIGKAGRTRCSSPLARARHRVNPSDHPHAAA